MNEDTIKKAFEHVKPSEELVDSVLSFKPEALRRKKISVKRIFCTAAAACAVLICGITAAAVTGLIDFEAIFGDHISVKDSELASSLVGTVSGFKYKVSDDDYKIDIKGVTGSDKTVTVIAEISRVDGVPVVDYFANPIPPDETLLECLWSESSLWLADDIFLIGYSGSWQFYINEAGNIEIWEEFESESKVSGKKITLEGENFYPSFTYRDFKNDCNVSYIKWDDYNFSGYAQRDKNGSITGANLVPAEVDDSGVIALDLEWEFSFKYTASDKSSEVKLMTDAEENFLIKPTVYSHIHQSVNHHLDDSDIIACEIMAVPTYIEAGSTDGSINFEYEMTEYDNNPDYSIGFFDNGSNELYIILKDGELVRCCVDSGSGEPDGNIYKCSCRMYYFDENDKRIFINADDIAAISINGTVYELS